MFVQSCFALVLLILVAPSHQNEKTILDQLRAELKASAAQHSLEVSAMRKELEEIRDEMKSRMSCNEQHNSQLTLEWAMDTVAELRREMKEMEAANNASGWQQELSNKVAAILAEAEGVTKMAAADEARLAAGEARHNELILDVKQVKEIATAARHKCTSLKEDIEKAQTDWKMGLKILNKKMYYMHSDSSVSNHKNIDDANFAFRKLRHMHSMHKQIHDMKNSHQQFYEDQKTMKRNLTELLNKIDQITEKNKVMDNLKLEEVAETQQKHSKTIQNLTTEIDDFNKMHISMLELLENMETLENKVNKAIPDFQREISKLEIDMIQIQSQNEYLKDDHEKVHLSVKAIAVSVSNLMDKVDRDSLFLKYINKTIDTISSNGNKNSVKSFEESKLNLDPKFLTHLEDSNDNEIPRRINRFPTSCDGIDGIIENYLISPENGKVVKTTCENGWTVIQQRINGSLDFNRNYLEYASSFGDSNGEFWIGNEALHKLTENNCSILRIEMVDVQGMSWYAEYDKFNVNSADLGYRLNIGKYSGNASDSLKYQNGMEFSTIDRDRDNSRNNCAANYEGGWWFSHCQHVNLNGKYSLGLTWFNSMENKWIEIAKSKMMTRQNSKCLQN